MEKTKKAGNAKFASFIKKNLYLILMIVCVIAIATMVAVTYATRHRSLDSAVDASAKEKEETPKDTQTETTATSEVVFALPLEGEFVGVFSNDTLVYNATLNQWSTHEAVDIAAPVGTDVKCVYDGTVKSITTSVLKGTEVVVAHENGTQSVYSLLGSDVAVQVDQKVKKGETIGKIAETGTFEKHKGPHLHLELYNAKGEKTDPAEFFESSNK